jgi:predicted nucleic acid-binding protein
VRALIDTNIAIFLRDGDHEITARLRTLSSLPLISVATRVELEGGVYRDPGTAPVLRQRLDLLLASLEELPFGTAEATVYGKIVESCGYSRPRLLDRMIAASALVAGARLITMNAADFKEIADLHLEDWGDR